MTLLTVSFRAAALLLGLSAVAVCQTTEDIGFTYSIGGSVPAPVTRDLYSQPSVTVTLVPDGAAWVSASVSSPTTPTVLTISVAPDNLQAGRYTSALRINSTQGYLIYNITLDVTGGSGSGGLTLSAASFTFNTAAGVTPPSQTLTVTSQTTVSATAQVSQQSCTGTTWLSLSPSGSFTAGTTGTSLTISVNPAGLASGTTCSGIVTITAGSVTRTASVTLNVGSTSGSLSVSPAALTFNGVAGGAAPAAQTLTVTVPSNTTATAQVSKQTCVNSDWLAISPEGAFSAITTGTLLTVSVNPATIAAGSTCTGSISITAGSVTKTASVTLNVTGITSSDLTLSASALTFSAGAGTPPPAGLSLSVTAPGSINASIQVSQQSCTSTTWLSLTPAGAFVASYIASVFTISVDQTGIAVGALCSGTVTITAGSTTKTIPVTLTVIRVPTGALTVKPALLNFNAVAGAGDPLAQTLTVTAPYDTSASVKVTQQSCTNVTWLTVSPVGPFTANETETTFTVSASAAGLPANSICTGTVTMNATAGFWGSTVVLKVAAPAPPTVSPSSLTFSAVAGGATPASQMLTVTVQAGVNLTATAVSQTCAASKWLNVASNGTLAAGAATFTVSVDQTDLGPGSICSGSISVVSDTGTQSLPVTLMVTSATFGTPVISTQPSALSFTAEDGKPSPAAQIVSVSGGGAAGTFSVSTSAAAWLRVSPACTAALPCSLPNLGTFDLTVTVDPVGLNAGATDNASLSLTGSGQMGSASVSVTFARITPPPVATLVTNAASYLTGPVSPGEMISIFAKPANPIGPATATALNDTTCPSPCTNVPTTMAGVQVIFQPGSVPAPITYVSNTQVNCMVPYEILGASAVEVQVSYLGQKSNAVALQYAATQPGIFTALGTGSGLASALQYDTDGTPRGQNSSNNPAMPGWHISFYATGEGIIRTPAVTGKVTSGASVLPLLGPPVVTIDNLPATVTYFAEADGIVSGVMQINAAIPAAVRSGQPVGISLAIDGRYSQPGVVIYMK